MQETDENQAKIHLEIVNLKSTEAELVQEQTVYVSLSVWMSFSEQDQRPQRFHSSKKLEQSLRLAS